MLTAHQQEALNAYIMLMAQRPSLFEGRRARPIVRDYEALAIYACNHNIVLGVAAETTYVYFIVDLVERISEKDGSVIRYPYLRVVSRKQLEGGINVVVLATIENPELGERGGIVLVEQERHAWDG